MLYFICIILFTLLFLLYFKYSNMVPILMYHRVADVKGDRNAISPNKFKDQLEYLHNHGFTTITISQLQDYYINQKPIPKKSVVLTFDDGYKDNYTTALPLLQKYNFVGNVFPISDWIGKENKWENYNKPLTITMNKNELVTWKKMGNYIGIHTKTHPHLSSITSPINMQSELQQSKMDLESLTETKIDCICYPYGNFNNFVINEAKKYGYKIGLAIFENVPLWNINLMALPRIPIPSGQKMWEFKLKVSKLHMIFIILRKIERSFKKLFR